MMDLGKIKDRIFRMTNNIYNDTHHMTDLVNDALTILSNDAKLEGITQIAVLSGTSNYPLPANFKSTRVLVEGTLDDPTTIFPLVPIEEFSYGYAVWNGEIVLKPTPSKDITLNLYYYKHAASVEEDADIPDIDAQYHEILTSYAAAMILSLPGMDNAPKHLIDRYFEIWEEGKKRFKTDMIKRNQQTSVRKVGGLR